MPKLRVVDFETTIRNKGTTAVSDFPADPLYDGNFVAYTGDRTILDHELQDLAFDSRAFGNIQGRKDHQPPLNYRRILFDADGEPVILIGQNIGFDLKYMIRDDRDLVLEWLRKGGKIMDVQQLEYILTGQRKKHASLNDLAKKYSGTQKNDKIKEYWDKGIDTTDIPELEVIDYLHDDLNNTTIVFLGQMAEFSRIYKGKGLASIINLIAAKMDSIIATTFMELDGSAFDRDNAVNESVALALVVSSLETKLSNHICLPPASTAETPLSAHAWTTAIFKEGDGPEHLPFNPSSNMDLQALLYGDIKSVIVARKVRDSAGEPVLYKSGARKGEQKFQNFSENVRIPGFCQALRSTTRPIPLELIDQFEKLESVDEQALRQRISLLDRMLTHTTLLGRNPHNYEVRLIKDMHIFLNDLLKLRRLKKNLSTYFVPYTEKCISKNTRHFLHPNYSHVGTSTGRVACYNPNLLNVSKKDYTEEGEGEITVKDMFISRYEHGFVVELDFTQIEVFALAVLSGDRQLVADLKSGEDLHRIRAAELFYGSDSPSNQARVDSRQRRIAKALSFMLQYGAGAKHMAEELGIPIGVAQKFIKNFYDRYPQVRKWHIELMDQLNDTQEITGKHTVHNKIPTYRGELMIPSGRRYVFEQEDVPWTSTEAFWPSTKVKNYPCQGFATGDVIALALSRILRELVKTNGLKATSGIHLIGTVYDSILFDVAGAPKLEVLLDVIRTALHNFAGYVEEQFDVDMLGLTFPFEIKAGANWGRGLKPVSLEKD